MFSHKENEVVGFDSQWKVTKISIASDVQTEEIRTADFSSATHNAAEVEIQTDALELPHVEYDEHHLAEFLNRAYPQMCRALEDFEVNQAFKKYSQNQREEMVNATLTKEIKLSARGSGDDPFIVSALSWNCTGNTIAISCSHDHQSWCHHTGLVKLFSYNRNDQMSSKAQSIYNTESCVIVLAFHTNLPNILAGGLYSGQIIIFNTQCNSENSVMLTVPSHEESFTQMRWILNSSVSVTPILITSGLDGFINVWEFNAVSHKLSLKEKYKIRSSLFGRLQRSTELPNNIANKTDRGIIDFDFSKFTPDMFIVGAEGGLVVRCSMIGSKPLKESTKQCMIMNPIFKYYKSHEGEIINVAMSPERREMFATSGTEGVIHVYIADQEDPAYVIYTQKLTNSLQWIPYEQELLVSCGNKGAIEMYNVITKKTVNINGTIENEDTVLVQMKINVKRPRIVAVGNNNGVLQFWSVPWNNYK